MCVHTVWAVCSPNLTQRTEECVAEYKRVSIRLNTHISVLKGFKGTVVNSIKNYNLRQKSDKNLTKIRHTKTKTPQKLNKNSTKIKKELDEI